MYTTLTYTNINMIVLGEKEKKRARSKRRKFFTGQYKISNSYTAGGTDGYTYSSVKLQFFIHSCCWVHQSSVIPVVFSVICTVSEEKPQSFTPCTQMLRMCDQQKLMAEVVGNRFTDVQ